uniref:Exportin-1/Importin-beta-like domain-containing protein n=1 Tax=Haptolina brevifila TaxID=156173 RepID=A0A7S2BL89_9EUKA
MTPIAQGHFSGQPPALVTSAVRLVGNYGKWLATDQQPLLEGCVRFVLQSLMVAPCAEHAAVAFRALCVHAQKQLGRFETVQVLLSICEPAMRNAELSVDLRIALTEGLARLVASLPTRDEQARQALSALMAPPCTLLQATLSQEHALRENAEAVATQITLIASSIRYCDRFRPEKHPVLPVMQAGCWELIMRVAGAYRGEARVFQALCELYSNLMSTLQTLLRPLLPQLLTSLAEAFTSTPVVGCLTTFRDAIERYGSQPDEELASVLSAVMTTIIDSVCAWQRTTADPEAQPELLTAFWEMCHRCLVFQPGLLLSLQCAPALFDAAIACVRHQEFQHTRAVLTFICLFMCPTEAANEYRETSAHCLQTSGAKLLKECLSGLASASPDNLVDYQVELIRVLIEACPTAVGTWLKQILSEPSGLSTGSVAPGSKAMQTFAALVLQQPALPQTEFQCVASDFSRICRGKLGPESLDRYVQRGGSAG